MHRETTTPAGWSEDAYANQSAGRKCRLGYVIGLMPCTLSGPRRAPRWPSKFTGEMAEGSLGGELYAVGEVVDHASLPRGFRGPLAGPLREPLHPQGDKADNRGEVLGPSLPEDTAVVGTCGIGQRELEPSGLFGRGGRRNGSYSTITGTGGLWAGNVPTTTLHFIQRGGRVVFPNLRSPTPVSTRLCNTYGAPSN